MSLTAVLERTEPSPALQDLVRRVAEGEGSDRELDTQICMYFFPDMGPCEPHCPGEQPIFWHDPLRKRPPPRLTYRIDAVVWLLRQVYPNFTWRLESPNYEYPTMEGERAYGVVADRQRLLEAMSEMRSPRPGDADARRGHYAQTHYGARGTNEARALLGAILNAAKHIQPGAHAHE